MEPVPTLRPPLDISRLRAAVPGWRVEIVEEIGSTNAAVAQRARDGQEPGLVLTTEHQYAGRGRLDRGWEMPPRAAIALSALVRPPASMPISSWAWLPLTVGVAVAEAVTDCGVEPQLKWPNDVLIDGRKVCGILVERVETAAGPTAVIGIGLNTNLSADQIPTQTGTSLMIELGHPVDRTEVIVSLLDSLSANLAMWQADPDLVVEAYRHQSATIGRTVRVSMPDGSVLLGTATGIESDGRLRVRDDAEVDHLVAAGDVIHATLT